MLAAFCWMPSTSATSLLLSSSKCRRARTSWSSGSMAAIACSTCSSVSARAAAWLGDVILPTSKAASEAEVVCGYRQPPGSTSRYGIAHLRAQVVPMDVGQRLHHDHPQPDERRNGVS